MDTKLEAFSTVWEQDPIQAIERVLTLRDIPVSRPCQTGALFLRLRDDTTVCVMLVKYRLYRLLSVTHSGGLWKETRPADTADQGFEAACWLAEVAEQ